MAENFFVDTLLGYFRDDASGSVFSSFENEIVQKIVEWSVLNPPENAKKLLDYSSEKLSDLGYEYIFNNSAYNPDFLKHVLSKCEQEDFRWFHQEDIPADRIALFREALREANE